ncbi:MULTISPECIES: DUF5709 domain-containing protein [Streptomyces]|uniref:DUF5709 domain-containing protein n=1 Tax=Streptomyces achmelvichensis TaxID=3134111 RepID=A0ACC6PP28_9ACTN|nr:DUF5709 domain-containing protein [Streptomyces sp. NBC_01167]
MSDDARGDDVYQPDATESQNRPTDDLDLENAIGERDLDDIVEEGYSPPERPLGVGKYGTTGEEQREGESLDQRLAQETPDVEPEPGDGIGDLPRGEGEPLDDEAGDARSGRLTQDGYASRQHNDVTARDVGIDGGAASAEEAAMHTIPDEEDGAP